ncbi:MAG: NAD(P)/FAD-dependent oxidoreductase [Hyphomicrobiaceae bacterium]
MPDSLWAAAAPPGPSCIPLTGDHTADVVIVGGGFTGLTAALHLAEAGTSVTLLEASEPGWGASGRNGGQVIPGMKFERSDLIEKYGEERGDKLWRDSGAFADDVFKLIEKHHIDCQHKQCGWIQPAHCPDALARLETRATDWSRVNADVEHLDASDTEKLLGTSWYVGGYLDRRAGRLNPLAYSRGLAKAAIAAGAKIHSWSMVTDMSFANGNWTVATRDGSINAETVILATNAYTTMDRHAPELAALARTVIPVYSYQIATRPLGDNIRRTILPEGHVASDTRRLLAYFSIDPAGRFIMGGRGDAKGSLEPKSFSYVNHLVRELYPQIGDIEPEYTWNGQVALTMDHLPHRFQMAPGLIAGLGYNGRGVTTATAMGKALADMASGAPDETIVFPRKDMRAVPMHGLRLPVIKAAGRLKAWQDRRDHRQ